MLNSLRLCSKAFLPIIFATPLLNACSSGGSGGGFPEPEATPTITVADLDFTQQYYEGEAVTLSLNAEGEAASRLSYHWEVSDGVEFQGQNTDTITFVAPQVTGTEVVSVEVEMTLDGGAGALMGESRQFGSVTVLDTDPPNIVAQGFQTDLPEVTSLDLSLLADATVFALHIYEQAEMPQTGEPIDVQSVRRITAVAQNSDTGTSSVRLCGEQNSLPLSQLTTPLVSDFNECASDLSFKYYQLGANLRVEGYCADTIAYAHNLTEVSPDMRAVQGLVTFSVDDFETLMESMQACMTKTASVASQYNDALAGPMKYEVAEATRFAIEVDQPAGPVVFNIVAGERIDRFGYISLGDFFEQDQHNSATLVAPAHPQLDGLEASGGSVDVRNLEEGEYEIDFDLTFETAEMPSAQIEGAAALYLP